MVSRPKKNDKRKNRNGSGTIAKVTQTMKKKGLNWNNICSTCSKCKKCSISNKKSTCQKPCGKCKNCTEKNCWQFNTYTKYVAMSPSENGERKYIGRFDSKKEAQEAIDNAKSNGFAERNDITLSELLKLDTNAKLDRNAITYGTYERNMIEVRRIEKSKLGQMKVQNIKTHDIQKYLNSFKDVLTKSSIDKIKYAISSAMEYAVDNNIIFESPSLKVKPVYSDIETKIAIPFDVEDQNTLLNYINTEPILTDVRSSLDSITFKNIVKLAFASGQRIGEILSLKYNDTDINFDKRYFIISKTIRKDKKSKKLTVGKGTKNSKKRERKGLKDYREIPFDIAPNNLIEKIFKEQIEHSKKIAGNNQHLVFCNNDGQIIRHSQVTETLKRICRKLKIQLDYETGCHIHQARHSFVTRCLEAGLKVETIADLIGDNVEQVQKTYAHILPKFKDNELNKLQQYYKKNNLTQ